MRRRRGPGGGAGDDGGDGGATALAADLAALLQARPREAEPGTRFYLVSARWFSRWRRLTKALRAARDTADAEAAARANDPGPVDNSDLLAEDVPEDAATAGGIFCAVRARLVEGFDFQAVGPEAWALIADIFGGGPALPREVVQSGPGETPELDIYPVRVKASLADPVSGDWRDERTQVLFVSRASPVAAFEDYLRRELGQSIGRPLPPEACRMYGYLYGGDLVRIASDRDSSATTVAKAPWCDDSDHARVLVEIIREDGTWPREQPRRQGASSSPEEASGAHMAQKRPRNGVAAYEGDADSRKRKGSLGDVQARSARATGDLDFSPREGHMTLSRQLAPPPQSAFAIIPGTREQGNPVYGPAPPPSFESSPVARVNVGNNRTSESLGVAGLRNLGNTCFMNATLQCLNQAQKLTSYLIDEPRLRATLRPSQNARTVQRLALAIADLTRMLWSSQHSVVTPGGFLRAVSGHNPTFADGCQHDAHEFLMWLLNGVHDDTNQARGTGNLQLDENGKERAARQQMQDIAMAHEAPREELARLGLAPAIGDRMQLSGESSDESGSEADSVLWESTRAARAADAWRRHHEIDDSEVLDLFQGQFESRLECELCRHVSSTFDVFTTLSLPVAMGLSSESGAGAAILTVDDCLAHYVQQEHLDADEQWLCSRCKELRPATKTISLVGPRLPHLLVLHLKRFRADGTKITSVVRFSETLNLEPYVSEAFQDADGERRPLRESRNLEYSLFGVVRHSGSLRGGHYTAHVKCADGNWRFINDSSVAVMSGPPDGLDAQAYMLFYSMR